VHLYWKLPYCNWILFRKSLATPISCRIISFFLSYFQSFRSCIKVFDLFRVNFCSGWKIWVYFSLLHVQNQFSKHPFWSYCLSSSLCFWLVCQRWDSIFMWLYFWVLYFIPLFFMSSFVVVVVTMALQPILKSDSDVRIPLELLFLLRISFTIQMFYSSILILRLAFLFLQRITVEFTYCPCGLGGPRWHLHVLK
jgi:hypothetical protein